MMAAKGGEALKTVRANEIKYVVSAALNTAAGVCGGGTLLQTFLGEIGLTDQIYLHATILQIVTTTATMVFSRAGGDGRTNVLRRCAVLSLPIAALYLLYVPLCVFPVPTVKAFLAALAVGVVQSLITAARTVVEFRVPYRAFPLSDYGAVSAVSGIAGSVTSMGIGALFTRLASAHPYLALMAWAFPAAAVLTLCGAVLTLSLKPVEDARDQVARNRTKISFRTLIRTPVFYVFLIPNLFRGVTAGVVGVLAAVALQMGRTAALTTAMVTAASAAGLGACLIYAVSAKRVPSRIAVFLGSVLLCLLPALYYAPSGRFLWIYVFVIAGRTFVDYGVPAALIRVVPDEIAGPFNAWRMVLHTGGSVLGTFLAGHVPIPALLIGAAALQLLSGIVYLTSPVLRTSRSGPVHRPDPNTGKETSL